MVRTLRAACATVAALFLCGACTVEDPLTDEPRPVPPTTTTSARGFNAAGTWHGTYTCNQGPTGLTLTVSGRGASLTAEFDFYATAEGSPAVPSGSFRMTGTALPRGVQLVKSSWISRPGNYEMVDLTATAPAGDSTRMDGEIHGYNCTTVHLRRVVA
jgi:hypothetical protein